MALAQPNTQQSVLMHRAAALTPSPTPTPAQLVHIKGPESDDGLDALISGHAAQRVEERREIKVVSENKLIKLLRFYLEEEQRVNILDGFKKRPTIILTPSEINSFLNAIILSYSETCCLEYKLSLFVTELIKKSYTAGYNNFVLNYSMFEKQINYLCKGIIAKPSKPIYIKIYGDLGTDCCLYAKYVNFDINGDVNSHCLGIDAEHCSFTITGNFNGLCLGGYFFGSSGKACSFKTPNERTLGEFMQYVSRINGHKIYYIHPDGTEELMRTN